MFPLLKLPIRTELPGVALGARFVEHMQGDFSYFIAAGLDVGLEHHLCLFHPPVGDRLENRGVLLVGGVDARRLGEIQPADDA